MVIVTRAVIGFTAVGRSLEFLRECGRPFLPGEMALLGELDCESERLSLPRFGKHRPTRVARQARKRLEALSGCNRIRLAQGSRPTCQYRRHRAARPGRPTAHGRRSAPSTRVAASRLETGRCYPERRKYRDRARWYPACRERSALSACGRPGACCGHARADRL